jgi:zinc transport system substrate-binding protein
MRPILRTERCGGAFAIAAVVVLSLSACTSREPPDDGAGLEVAAGFYPLAYAAEQIGGDCVDVVNLTPPGVEPHDLELTPDDVEALATADVVIYLGGGFQPAIEDAIGEVQGEAIDVLATTDTVPASSDEASTGLTVDPHVWLDPALFASTVPAVVEAMDRAAPASDCDFRANGDRLVRQLETLDREFAAGLRECRHRTLVTNHSAFGYLADAYGLTQLPISGLEPDAEPTPERLAELADLVRREGITTVFSEELVSPEVAQTLADEAGVDVRVLSTLEGLTEDELTAGDDYRSVMLANLETLRSALDCG